MKDRLSPVRCGRCNRPVTHMNKRVPGAEGGGLCTNRDCERDENGKRIFVYTYCGVVIPE